MKLYYLELKLSDVAMFWYGLKNKYPSLELSNIIRLVKLNDYQSLDRASGDIKLASELEYFPKLSYSDSANLEMYGLSLVYNSTTSHWILNREILNLPQFTEWERINKINQVI